MVREDRYGNIAGQIDPIWDKSGILGIRFQYIYVLKSDLKKSQNCQLLTIVLFRFFLLFVCHSDSTSFFLDALIVYLQSDEDKS